jgi:hypothetical protein
MVNPNQLIALGCWMILASLQGCSRESDNADVQFAKTAFFAMVNGTPAETTIDWERFQAMGDDLGKEYQALASDAEKAFFRRQFLLGFAASTPNIKENPGGITHWRVQSENPSETIVAADMKKGVVLLLTVSKRDGKQKLSAMKIEESGSL